MTATKLELAAAASTVCLVTWDGRIDDKEAARSTSVEAAKTWREAVFEEGHLVGSEFHLGHLIIPINIAMLPFSGYTADESGARGWLADKTSYSWAIRAGTKS